VTVELEDGKGDGAPDIVRALPDVHEVLLEGRRLHARVEHGAAAVPAILAALDSGGVPVAAVTVARPSLDDVYLHYTGRDFRSEDEAGA
jgi:ABC-2 type transport system ATP-binding protein